MFKCDTATAPKRYTMMTYTSLGHWDEREIEAHMKAIHDQEKEQQHKRDMDLLALHSSIEQNLEKMKTLKE